MSNIIIVADDINVFEVVQREYDFSKGDRRFVDHAEAVAHAEAEASRTGVRQQVRLDSPHGLEVLYLVQAIGS